MAHVQQIRIAARIIGEMMMCHVKQPVEVHGRQQREHAEEVGYQVVQQAILHEAMVRRLVAQSRQPVLDAPDEADRHREHRYVR